MTSPAEAAIRAEIARRGPIHFADFMALALGHAEGGYYTAAAPRPTRGGDFLTAPELHPIFGAALARQVAEAWERLGRPAPFTLLEYGAGAGTLALAILAGLREDGSPLADTLVYAPVELNRHRLAELGARAAAAGVRVVDPAGLDAAPTAGVVLANEFLDALPVHVLEVRDGRAREVRVTVEADGSFGETLGASLDPAILDQLERLAREGVALAEGQRMEVRPAVEAWAREVGRRLAAGLVLVLDYGAPAADLYGPRRRAGTLMTYRGHAAEGDAGAPYRDVGERDITAHVDTTALGAALVGAGLDLLGETSQAEMLVGCGLEQLMQRRQAGVTRVSDALELRGAVMRLLDPRHLGGFRAVMGARGIAAEPLPCGLSYRMPGRR
ncbi:MAG TPA: SAM-dependent methyltransferase [Candidatus Nanopelagicales bacterium]|nr:SAM-dependent methyltransferase [Candidatus Nanopelagicales bacterium]